jgi:hypothetical protein
VGAASPETTLDKLTDPVRLQDIADFLRVSLNTVYGEVRKHDALRIKRDAAIDPLERAALTRAMRRCIPCRHFGGIPQKNGTFKGGRYKVSREAFLRWWEDTGGEDLYEEVAS